MSKENIFKELQSFWKGIDMRNSKITNLGAPTLPTDGVNLEYVRTSESKLMTRLAALEEVAQQASATESHFRKFIDNHKWSGESISFGTIDMNRLPVHLYGFILEIGPNLGKIQKTSIHTVQLPLNTNISYTKINLQITLLQEARQTNDDLFCSLKSFDVEHIEKVGTLIMLIVNTHRTVFGWGINLKAHLLVTIFETEMLVIKNSTK